MAPRVDMAATGAAAARTDKDRCPRDPREFLESGRIGRRFVTTNDERDDASGARAVSEGRTRAAGRMATL